MIKIEFEKRKIFRYIIYIYIMYIGAGKHEQRHNGYGTRFGEDERLTFAIAAVILSTRGRPNVLKKISNRSDDGPRGDAFFRQ